MNVLNHGWLWTCLNSNCQASRDEYWRPTEETANYAAGDHSKATSHPVRVTQFNLKEQDDPA